MEFAEYALKYSKPALESRKSLPVELLPLLGEIESGLADDPDRHSGRLTPVSRDGKSWLYSHPDPQLQVTFEIDRETKIIYFFHYSAPALKVRKSIFISYSHKDEPWLLKLKAFLGVLEQQGVIHFWDDSQLEPGKPWEDQINEALEGAHAGVLLVSQDFLASSFITGKELPRLLNDAAQQGKRIFWIHLSPSTVFDTHKEITKFQSLLRDPQQTLEELPEAQQKKMLVQISKELAKAVASN